jgi:hypothetical protein
MNDTALPGIDDSVLLKELLRLVNNQQNLINIIGTLVEGSQSWFAPQMDPETAFNKFIVKLKGLSDDDRLKILRALATKHPGSKVFSPRDQENGSPVHKEMFRGNKPQQPNVRERIKVHSGQEVEDCHFPACEKPNEQPCEAKEQVCLWMAESSSNFLGVKYRLSVTAKLTRIHKDITALIDSYQDNKIKEIKMIAASLKNNLANLFEIVSSPECTYFDKPSDGSPSIVRLKCLVNQCIFPADNYMITLDRFDILRSALNLDEHGNETGEVPRNIEDVISDKVCVALLDLAKDLPSIIVGVGNSVEVMCKNNAMYIWDGLITILSQQCLNHDDFSIIAKSRTQLPNSIHCN